MSSVWSNQPFKALYTVFFVLKLVVLVPLVSLRYSLRAARSSPEWSLRVCVLAVFTREFFDYYARTRSHGLAAVQAAHVKANSQFSLAEVADPSLYSALLAPGAAKPAPVGGLWFPGPPTPETDLRHEKVVLHFPGGAFVLAFGTPTSGKDVAGVMTRHLKATRTFVAQYRLSTDDSTRFPAALQDLVTFYCHILSLGLDPKNVILSGDSAAGNLVIALLRYLEDLRSPRLPLPGGAMLWSPWVHVTAEAGRDYAGCRNSDKDVLTASVLQWGADAYLPRGKPTADTLPFISPLHHPFRTSVPLFINAGGSEAFFDSAKDFAREMAEVRGNRIRFHATDLSPHNLLMSHKGLGMNHQMEVAAKDAYSFFN
ncbi:alpha/beta-hydrolase [Hypoxylon rubiginosum]|uniref:Alpha/beta-hydrolase n=1 Tax=Hypoxylon rubiginosum TaxID=110542 RepID=A0ACB9YLJ5_9PEZI|nr:alpha/beta-hydrolase [Hypoxylon rubiginosum]